MAAVEYGDAFVLTRGGVAVAELTPVLRRRFVPADVAVAEFAVDGFPSGTATTAGERPAACLLDTSAPMTLGHPIPDSLPRRLAICALSTAELAGRVHATDDPGERARRIDLLQQAE